MGHPQYPQPEKPSLWRNRVTGDVFQWVSGINSRFIEGVEFVPVLRAGIKFTPKIQSQYTYVRKDSLERTK